MTSSLTIPTELLHLITGGVDAPKADQGIASRIGETIAPKDCNGELGFGGMLTAAEIGLHTPGPVWMKMGAAAAGAVGGLYAGCRMGNRPTAEK